jgi:hypothetical protein
MVCCPLPPSISLPHLPSLSANFHLLRSVPTDLEKGKSLNRWQHGIFYPWDLEEPDTAFPYQYGIDSNVRPSLSVIRVPLVLLPLDFPHCCCCPPLPPHLQVDGKYVRHVEKDHSNNRYTHKGDHTSVSTSPPPPPSSLMTLPPCTDEGWLRAALPIEKIAKGR